VHACFTMFCSTTYTTSGEYYTVITCRKEERLRPATTVRIAQGAVESAASAELVTKTTSARPRADAKRLAASSSNHQVVADLGTLIRGDDMSSLCAGSTKSPNYSQRVRYVMPHYNHNQL
jgi:hypothetical protein